MAIVQNGINPPFMPIGGFDRPVARPKVDGAGASSFEKLFRDQLHDSGDVTFSEHAKKRIHSRNIELNPEALQNLNDAVRKAEQKGARESLILMGENGFIVSIKNKTVITAANQSELKESVFTNIDSAVII